MQTILVHATEKHLGNLYWAPPYLFPEDELEVGIEQLTEKGYWASAFPEGDGFCFKKDGISRSDIENDFRIAFPWMEIKISQNDNYNSSELLKYQTIVMPLSRLMVEDVIHTEKYSIYHAGYFFTQEMNPVNFDGTPFDPKESSTKLRDHINHLTGISLEVFDTCPLIIFQVQLMTYMEFRAKSQIEDPYIIKKLSVLADEILHVVRFYCGDYVHPEFMPAKPGLWFDRYSAAMIYYPDFKTSHVLSREVEVKTFIKSIGMEITRLDYIRYCMLLNGSTAETGMIAKHALKLNTNIMEMDDPTVKFIQIMNLFEYLGNPFEFEKMQDIKKKIAPLFAKDKADYQSILTRFEELTKGIKDAQGNLVVGYRTEIVHNGELLEDLVPAIQDRNALFEELHGYTYAIIQAMIMNSYLSWEDFRINCDQLRATFIN